MRIAVLLSAFAGLSVAADCDRDCLRNTITQYLNAMVAHDPAKLSVAPAVRFTEDAVTMKLGEGLWKGA